MILETLYAVTKRILYSEKASDAPEPSVFGYYWMRKDPRRTGLFQPTKSRSLFKPDTAENIKNP